jgi:hypothetical protein
MFKIGDEVRVLYGGPESTWYNNIGVISQIWPDGHYSVFITEGSWKTFSGAFGPENLELITPPTIEECF